MSIFKLITLHVFIDMFMQLPFHVIDYQLRRMTMVVHKNESTIYKMYNADDASTSTYL